MRFQLLSVRSEWHTLMPPRFGLVYTEQGHWARLCGPTAAKLRTIETSWVRHEGHSEPAQVRATVPAPTTLLRTAHIRKVWTSQLIFSDSRCTATAARSNAVGEWSIEVPRLSRENEPATQELANLLWRNQNTLPNTGSSQMLPKGAIYQPLLHPTNSDGTLISPFLTSISLLL